MKIYVLQLYQQYDEYTENLCVSPDLNIIEKALYKNFDTDQFNKNKTWADIAVLETWNNGKKVRKDLHEEEIIDFLNKELHQERQTPTLSR